MQKNYVTLIRVYLTFKHTKHLPVDPKLSLKLTELPFYALGQDGLGMPSFLVIRAPYRCQLVSTRRASLKKRNGYLFCVVNYRICN